MITQQETIYRCEHCNRPMFGKGAMTLHEKLCSKNPNNRHQCFKYCKWITKDYIRTSEDEVETIFYCGNENCPFHDKDLYSYKFERLIMNREKAKTMTRMPLECDFYEIEEGHDDFPTD